MDQWDINLFDASENAKYVLVFSMIEKMGFMEKYKIANWQLSNCLHELNMAYSKDKNPFHNFVHGVGVCHAAYYLQRQTSLKLYLSGIQQFAFIIGALCHDVGHRGKTNAFEINTLSKLSQRYHDVSPLEQYHAAVGMEILWKKENNIIQGLISEDFKIFRKFFIKNILGTDMKCHFDMQIKFKENLEAYKDLNNITDENKLSISAQFTHIADLSGPVKKYELSWKWSKKVNEEFMKQAKDEERLNLPVTSYFQSLDIDEVYYKNEMNFYKFVVTPQWGLASDFLNNEISEMYGNCQSNLKQIEDKLKVIELYELNGMNFVD